MPSRLTVPAALAPAKPGDHVDAHFDAEEDAIVDSYIAATARRHGLTIATGNDRGLQATS